MTDPLIRRLKGDNLPRQYWTVTWSHDSATDDGQYQYFVGPYAEAQARAFAAALGIDLERGYVRVTNVTPPRKEPA